MFSSKIIATGSYLPENCVTNADFAKIVDTNDEWIRTRTGIEMRYFAAEDETTSDMGAKAAEDLLKNSNIDRQDIDLIIVATTTPDKTFPATAALVQAKLGIKSCATFDVQAVCAGFLSSLYIANSLIATGAKKNILIIGAEKMSSVLDLKDRATCVLFGDGAGCILLAASENKNTGLLAAHLDSAGECSGLLETTGGVSSNKIAGVVTMKGQEVFKNAVNKMSESSKIVLEEAGLTGDDIDWFIPHQANLRIINAVADKLQFPMEKVIVTVDRHANTSAASIPLALDYANKKGQIKEGDKLLFAAIGAGLAWGAAIFEW